MKTKQLIVRLNNSQKIRVILNGIGFYTTVKGTENMAFTSQRIAIQSTLQTMATQKVTGLAMSQKVYGSNMEYDTYSVQVDMV